jgi:hypothetical protein
MRFESLAWNDFVLNSLPHRSATFGGGAFRFRGGRFTQYLKAQGLASDIVTVYGSVLSR